MFVFKLLQNFSSKVIAEGILESSRGFTSVNVEEFNLYISAPSSGEVLSIALKLTG